MLCECGHTRCVFVFGKVETQGVYLCLQVLWRHRVIGCKCAMQMCYANVRCKFGTHGDTCTYHTHKHCLMSVLKCKQLTHRAPIKHSLSLSLSLSVSLSVSLSLSLRLATYTVRANKILLPKCTQPNKDGMNVLPQTNLYVAMRHELSYHFAGLSVTCDSEPLFSKHRLVVKSRRSSHNHWHNHYFPLLLALI